MSENKTETKLESKNMINKKLMCKLTINDKYGSHTHSYHHGQAVFTQWMTVLKFVDSTCGPPPSRHLAGLQLMTLDTQSAAAHLFQDLSA